MNSVENSNVDIEILALIIGITRTSEISKISEESISKMLATLQPENHGFFYFIKDCLMHMVSRLGEEETSKKLEISVPAIQIIKKHGNKLNKIVKPAVKKQVNLKNDELKNEIIDYYNTCKSITQTAAFFKIKKEQAISYVISSAELID